MSTTDDPADPRLTRGADAEPAPQAEVYLVLSEAVDVDGRIAAGLVMLATVAETALGPWPALIFRFSDGHGQFLPDVLLLLDDVKAHDLPALVTSATASAVRAAKKARA